MNRPRTIPLKTWLVETVITTVPVVLVVITSGTALDQASGPVMSGGRAVCVSFPPGDRTQLPPPIRKAHPWNRSGLPVTAGLGASAPEYG